MAILEDLLKFSAVISNAELLELTTETRECVTINHRKQTNITNFFS